VDAKWSPDALRLGGIEPTLHSVAVTVIVVVHCEIIVSRDLTRGTLYEID